MQACHSLTLSYVDWNFSLSCTKLCFLNVCVAAEQQRKTGYCPCGKPDDDYMVACDEQGCKNKWFHFVCVRLDGKSIPDGDWCCPECLGKHVIAFFSFSLCKSGFLKENWDAGGKETGGSWCEICSKFALSSKLK